MGRKRVTFNRHREWAKAAMRKNAEARNSDWELMFQILEDEGIALRDKHKEAIRNSGLNMHTMVRERRRLQAEGEYIPTRTEVLKVRKLYEQHYIQEFTN